MVDGHTSTGERDRDTDMRVLIGEEQDIDFAVAAAAKQSTVIRPEAVFSGQAKLVTGDNKLLSKMTPILCQSIGFFIHTPCCFLGQF